ncbi:oxygen-insensitive NADPH nitroreductase [Christensenellaceae bacterium OttesenSCG-928-M15]|nr:oxygen-insensitive NADPH nitroreductase [Christensenellaceae bacterium OttesenSCG-928-M15]
MNETMELLLAHKSVRRYLDKPVADEVRDLVVQAAQFAPSSCFYQAYTMIQVNDTAVRQELSALSGGQKCLLEAPLVLVFLADFYRGSKYYENIDPAILGSAEYYTVAVADAALAGQKALIAAQSMGLGGVMVGGIRNDVSKVAALLKLPELTFPLFALCLGYPADDPGQKPRLPMGLVLKQDVYDESADERLMEEYNKTIAAYYRARSNGAIEDRWTERAGKSLMEETREDVADYLRAHGFLQR